MALSKIEGNSLDIGQVGGRRNLIINGAMQVWQRGTSKVNSGSGYGQYHADRWASYYGGQTISKESSSLPDGSLVSTLRVTDTSGSAGNLCFTYTKVENGSHIISGKPVTLSFWAKSNQTQTNKLRARFRFYDNATENGANEHILESGETLTSSWQKYEYTITATDSSLNATRDLMVIIDLWEGFTSASDYIEFTQVQLELGSVATPFEHRSYGEELLSCKRYWREMKVAIGCLPWAGVNTGWAPNDGGETVQLDPEMRASPSVTQVVTPTYSSTEGSLPNSTTGTSSNVNVNHNTYPDRLYVRNNASGNVIFAVSTHYYLDAEL